MSPAPLAGGTAMREALEGAVGALTAAGVEDPRLDAEVLLSEATGRDRAELASQPESEIPSDAGREFAEMVRRRVRREPLAYITGRKGFRGIELEVDSRVLIPRPETELLVEVALEMRPSKVLDVGTGSGAVALAIADELPGIEIAATDISEGALAAARGNARRLGKTHKVRFLPGLLPPYESFDLVLANLPYVRESEWDSLAPEIREFEPRVALVAAGDGLASIRELLEALDPATAPAIALEVGAGQADQVRSMVEAAGYPSTEVRPDLAGIDRVVIGRAGG